MHLRPFGSLTAFALTAAVAGGLSLYAAPARAAGEQDKAALKLHDQAMDEDYLAVEFDKAEKKLKDALKKCGDDGCSPKVLGKLHIALGTVYGGASKINQSTDEFVLALKADPNATLIESLTTPELTKAFEKAKELAKPKATPKGPDKPPPKDGGEEDGGEDGGEKGPAGDLDHTPVTEQAVNTPVPIYIEPGEDVEIKKGTVKYKPFGATQWKTVELNRVGKGWGGYIPCEDVTTTGDVKYYITLTDDAGDTLKAGSKKDPYKVQIKREIEGDEPQLPGKKPPEQCEAKEDCPPGLPGCPNGKGEKRGDKGWGASCEADQECQAGLICNNSTCEEGKRDGDGGGGTPASGGKKNIIGLGVQADLMVISSAENVCSGSQASYYCFYQGSSDRFWGAPIAAQGTNGIQGGFAPAGVRINLQYDRELTQIGPGTLNVGARAGLALGGIPENDQKPPNDRHTSLVSFPPLHLEARIGYSFLGSGLEAGKARPYGFIGGGFAKVSASVPVTVCDRFEKDGETPVSDDDCPGSTNAVRRELDAYQISGLNFISVGGGVIYGITPNFGVMAELKAMFMVTTFAVVIAPSIGPVLAF